MKRMILGVGVVLMGLLLVVSSASAEIPHLINFQGRLTDVTGAPVPDGTPIKFSIYNVSGTALWSETHPSDSDSNGIFNVLLGSVTALNLPFDEDYWLGIKVGTDSEMTPRQRITSVGYAFNADRVKGSNILPSSGNVGIGTTGPIHNLEIKGSASTPTLTALTKGIFGITEPNTKLVTTIDDNTPFTASIQHKHTSLDGYSYPIALNPLGGNVGIGTTSPVNRLTVDGVIGVLNSTTCGLRLFDGSSQDITAVNLYNSGNGNLEIFKGTTHMVIVKGDAGGRVGIGTRSPTEKLHVAGKVKAQEFITGDITFQKDNESLWRMFEDEDGLYLESLKTGKVYRFVLKEVKDE